MQNLDLKISIVIPAYNEEDHIAACLEAVSRLSVKPFEVIVVNNSSTDKTADIARKFPFVRVVDEPRLGLVYARDRCFNSARGEIIGRIDADTLVPKDWTEKVNQIFQDSSVQAVSGGLHFYDIGMSRTLDAVDAYWRAWMARRMKPSGRVFLLGANMAIRKTSWEKVRSEVCHESGLHEDLDLALHLSYIKQKVVFDPSLMANYSARRIDSGFITLAKYCMLSPSTYSQHDAKEHRYMYPIVIIVIANYLLLRLLFRAFDERAERFSLKTLLFSQSPTRVNPAELV